jgi:hypothetical protein
VDFAVVDALRAETGRVVDLPAALTVVVLPGADCAATVLMPALAVAGLPAPLTVVLLVLLVGAFLAAGIPMFLLANDCGLVSAWRLTSSGLDTGSRRPA